MEYTKITIEINDPEKGYQKSVYTADNLEMSQQRDVIKTIDRIGSSKMGFKPGKSVMLIEIVAPTYVPEESTPTPTLKEALSGCVAGRTLTEEEIRNSKIDIPGAIAADLGRRAREESMLRMSESVKEEASKMPEEKIKRCKFCGLPVDKDGLGDACSGCLPNARALSDEYKMKTVGAYTFNASKVGKAGKMPDDVPTIDTLKQRVFLPGDYQSIEKDLADLINKQSRENRSNTPDFILAQYMARCLKALEDAVNARDSFYGLHPEPGSHLIGPVSMKGPMTAEEEKEYIAKVQKKLDEMREKFIHTPGQIFGRPIIEGVMKDALNFMQAQKAMRERAVERITPGSVAKTFKISWDFVFNEKPITLFRLVTAHDEDAALQQASKWKGWRGTWDDMLKKGNIRCTVATEEDILIEHQAKTILFYDTPDDDAEEGQ